MAPRKPRWAVYKRVSTDGQDVDMQNHAITQWLAVREIEPHREFTDKAVSAAAKVRPAFQRMMAAVEDGEVDVVLVWRFDRVSRSTRELLTLLDVFQSKKVDFISIHEQIDTTTPAGRLMFTLIAGLAEFERSLIRERTRAGMAAAKARGAKIGKRRALSEEQESEARRLYAVGLRQQEIADKFGVSPSVISRTVRC